MRIYFLQHGFNLPDFGAEEALYESRSLCRFVGIDLGREPVPDETTILNFRHRLERHELGDPLFRSVGEYLRYKPLSDTDRLRNRTKSKVRAKVEQVFGVMKRVFACNQVRYRGLGKKAHALFVLSALTHWYLARRKPGCLA